MTHWAWYWKVKKKHISRKVCSNLVSIDSFKVFKQGAETGFTVQPLQIKAEPGLGYLKVTYRDRKNSTYSIPIDKLPCNYGGFRYFFRCPLCQARMRKLYLAENSLFLCRKCLNLSYETQSLRPTRRYDYMSKKIKQLIKDRGGDIDFWQKPPGMHQETYQKLRKWHSYYESMSSYTLSNEIREWHGHKMPNFDDYFDYIPEKPA